MADISLAKDAEPGINSQDRRNAMAAGRLALVQTEIARRKVTGEQFGFVLPDWQDPAAAGANAHLLLVATDADERHRLTEALKDMGTVTAAADEASAEAAFASRVFDAAVLAAEPEAMRALCKSARETEARRAMPILILTDSQDTAPASGEVSDTMFRPWRTADLCNRLRLLVGRSRYDRAVHQTIPRGSAPLAIDPLTGLFSHSFLYDHLASQIADAHKGNRPLSVGWLSLQGLEEVNEQSGYAAGDRLLQQVGLLVGHLTRTEDLAARHSAANFCVTLFDTDLVGAQAMVRRLTSIIDHTQFAVADLAEPVIVGIQSGTASFCAGDTAATLIARAAQDARRQP